MKQTTLSKIKDNGKFKLSKYSKTIYTKVKKIAGAIVITSDGSGRSYEKKGRTKCWPFVFIVNKSTGSTVARKTN